VPSSSFEEGTILLSCKLIIKTFDEKECRINLCIKFTLTSLDLILFFKQYKLINDYNYNYIKKEKAKHEFYYKLDTTFFTINEQIEFEIINNLTKEDIEFYVSAIFWVNNTSKKPELIPGLMNNDKIINFFKIKIPNYSSDNSNDIPKLNFLYEIKINEDLIIYIIIYALIKFDITQLFMFKFI